MSKSADLLVLRESLTRLLETVESEGSAASVSAAWKECDQAFEGVGDLSAPGALNDSDRALLVDIVRLDKLVRASAARGKTQARAALRMVRERKRSTEYYVPEGRNGRSCDVSA